jgi:gliding motility-associated-like protein
MNNFKKIIFFFFFIAFQNNSKAQSNLGCAWDSLMGQMLCGSWSIQGDDVNLCNDGVKIWLQYNAGAVAYNDSLVQFAFGSTDSYAVSVKPYNWETLTTPNSPSNFTVDDEMSDAIKIPFPFCFYGVKRDSLVIGSNGRINFDPSLAGTFDDYQLTTYGPIPFNDPYYMNSVFSPFHDIDVSVGGTIQYGIVGLTPCRKFVITWSNAPMFNCNSLIANQQIVLHEQSFKVEVNVMNKEICAGWEGGLGYLGIQGNSLAQFAALPAYNSATLWNATNLSIQFQPIGKQNLTATSTPGNLQVYWVDSFSNNVIGVGDTLVYFPSQDTTIYLFIGDTNLLNNPLYLAGNDSLNTCGKGLSCGGFSPYKRLTVIKTIADFNFTQAADCQGTTITFNNTSKYANSYTWSFGDGTSSTMANPTHYYLGSNPFIVTLVANGPYCTDTLIIPITPIFIAVKAQFNLNNISFCSTTPLIGTNTSVGSPPLTFVWSMGDGAIYSTNNVNHSYASNGPKNVQLVVKDAGNCIDSIAQIINVELKQNFAINVSQNIACTGQPITITGNSNSSLININWNFGDGTSQNGGNPVNYSYASQGVYTVSCVADYSICPNQTATVVIQIDSFPIVELGKPEPICAGRESKVIMDSFNIGATYIWSTGTVGTNSITVNVPGLYDVEVTNGVCTTKDRKELFLDLDCINIMNAFTPNGDKLNVYFKPLWYSNDDIGSYSVRIFNRYGQEVYNSQNKTDLGWDGTYKEILCDMGVYIYTMTIKDKLGNVRNINSDLTLIR